MNRFNQQRSSPHLDVYSQNLVYLTGVPTTIGGKELKRRLTNQFGQVKFVETFEAWNGRLTGNIVIDFSTYDDSEAFMTAVIKGRINFLDGAGIQHITIVGPRHFFELIHHNTGIDLFLCDGKPNTSWIRNYRRTSGGKPYDRPSRGNSPLGTGSNLIPLTAAGPNRPIPRNNENPLGGGVKSGGHTFNSPNTQPRSSSSDEEHYDKMVGPFPTSSSVSASLRHDSGQKRTIGE